MKMTIYIKLLLCMLFLVGCQTQTLPPQQLVDLIRVESNYPKKELNVISNPSEVKEIVAFINTYQKGWGVPWYGPPVGTVYLELYKNGKFVGNFYVGSNYFGRDYGNFWSQSASNSEIQKLGSLIGIDLLQIVRAEK